ncbi:MAG: thioredoxin family protein [Balneola sp.]|nr:MAG: thioredoxin family protein [Balneola sp.]
MNKNNLLLLFLVVFFIGSTGQNPEELAIGSALPMADHKVEDVSGRSLTLGEVADENGLLVIFSCNTCPWVMKWNDRYPDMSRIAKENKIGMIALNPNEDYRDRGDGMDDMIKYAKKSDYDFPYALDKNHEIADAFGASRTPHVYLFNGEMELVYVGAIDDNANDASAVKEYYIKDAIEQLVAGEELTRSNTKSLGCTIKRVS